MFVMNSYFKLGMFAKFGMINQVVRLTIYFKFE